MTRRSRRFLALASMISMWGCASKSPPSVANALWKPGIEELKRNLARDGLSARQIKPLSTRRVRYIDRAVESKMLNICRPSPDLVERIDSRAMEKAQEFLSRYKNAFEVARSESGVPPELVVSILWIETKFGSYPGKYEVLNAITSLASIAVPSIKPQVVTEITRRASEEDKKRNDNCAERVVWEERVENVGRKWYEELKAFLLLADLRGWRSNEIMGSWAGAMGYGQFLPTTALRNMISKDAYLADLWKWEDTIRLIARHLAENGWNDRGTEEEKKGAIFKYNQMKAYVDAVYEMSRRVVAASQTATETR